MNMIEKGMRNPTKIPPYICRQIDRVASKLWISRINQLIYTDESDVYNCSEPLWSDNPEIFEFELDSLPQGTGWNKDNPLFTPKTENVDLGYTRIQYQPSKRFITTFDDVTVYTQLKDHSNKYGDMSFSYVIVNKNGQIIGPLNGESEARSKRTILSYYRDLDPKTRYLDITLGLYDDYLKNIKNNIHDVNTGFLLTPVRRQQFGHWFLEYLTKLQRVHQYEMLTGTHPTLVLRSDTPNWQKKMLRLAGFHKNKWKFINTDGIKIKNLIYTDHKSGHRHHFNICREDFEWVNDMIGGSSNSYSSRVLLSRKSSRRRKILNFDATESMLSEYGFESYCPGEMNFKDQIRLFEQAKIIVAPFGSELANITFGNNLDIISIHPPCETISPIYLALAECLGHRYKTLISKQIPGERDNKCWRKNIEVDLDDLEEAVLALT
jgi:hypothetical protein